MISFLNVVFLYFPCLCLSTLVSCGLALLLSCYSIFCFHLHFMSNNSAIRILHTLIITAYTSDLSKDMVSCRKAVKYSLATGIFTSDKSRRGGKRYLFSIPCQSFVAIYLPFAPSLAKPCKS